MSAEQASTAPLIRSAQEWIARDPDATTCAQLTAAIERADHDELSDLVGRRLEFGTAGLRGPIGPGPNRMNRLVVRQAAAGLSRHLLASGTDCSARGVVVGRDARHGSEDFAADVVEVISAHGITVHAFDEPVPTPLVAFALGRLRAAAGVVITASHNPASDNGMKLYWGDGAQIVAPVDEAIADAIDAVAIDGQIQPTTIDGSVGEVHRLGGAATADTIAEAYVDAACAIVTSGPPLTPVRIASTSLHGVGAVLLERVLRAAGYADLHAVESQRRPDPDFPTVRFPNPEEPGALDELVALAAQIQADVALANDPDADRLAIAVIDRSGAWRTLSGDETGALLAHRLLETSSPSEQRLLATTVVSSRLTARMAEAAGVDFHETLTGFKWLCRPGLARPELRQLLLYEEALGYAVGQHTRDKDGITAALVVVDLIADLIRTRRTVWDVLDELARRHGAHVQRNGSARLAGPGWHDRLDQLIHRLVERPPTALGGQPVVRTHQPAADVLRMFLADGTRVVIRPSGTEAKVKYYCEAIEPVATTPHAARLDAGTRLGEIVRDVVRLLAV